MFYIEHALWENCMIVNWAGWSDAGKGADTERLNSYQGQSVLGSENTFAKASPRCCGGITIHSASIRENID